MLCIVIIILNKATVTTTKATIYLKKEPMTQTIKYVSLLFLGTTQANLLNHEHAYGEIVYSVKKVIRFHFEAGIFFIKHYTQLKS